MVNFHINANTMSKTVLVTLLVFLGACGGGGGASNGGNAQTATGVFKDANVEGLSFRSGGQSGVTGPGGAFTYEVGQPVSFSVGGAVIGSATGQAVITPLDLVTGSTTNTARVQNIVRFLVMLDTDNNPANGIGISSAVRSAAASWAVNFDAADLATELALIVAAASTADGTTHTLPTAAAAQSHLESTLLCARSGAFRGTFAGTDNGPFGIMIDAATGVASGVAFSTKNRARLTLTGATAVSFDQSATFVTGDTSTRATFSGQFKGTDQVSGTWENTRFAESGTFSGNRIGSAADAVNRFTARVSGDAAGLFTFDVSATGAVTGIAYSIRSIVPDLVVTDEEATSGTLSGTTLTAMTIESTSGNATTINGTLNTSTGGLTGTWVDLNGHSGTFSGSGCRLN